MTPFLAELTGTCVLMTLGNGVVANVVLPSSKGHGAGWIVIALGWAMAVFCGVFVASRGSEAHLNPAVTLAFAALGKFNWNDVPLYMAGQFLGAILGSFLVWVCYQQQFNATTDAGLKRACFCTSPAIHNPFSNLLTEALATFVLILGVLFIQSPETEMGAIKAIPVSFLVLAIGLGLGGPTGYAINPARDLGPRLLHAILPLTPKGTSDWGYAWIPVAGPVIGALCAAGIFSLLQ